MTWLFLWPALIAAFLFAWVRGLGCKVNHSQSWERAKQRREQTPDGDWPSVPTFHAPELHQ